MFELTANTHNTISYTGTVNITLNTKGHKSPLKLKNSGTKHLMDTIARALAGYSINGCTPRYVDIQQQLDGEPYETVLRSRVPFTGIVHGVPAGADVGSDCSKILMNATITYEDKQPIAVLNSTARLVMLDSAMRPLATINSDIPLLWEKITESTDAFIEWTLTFENSTSGGTA